MPKRYTVQYVVTRKDCVLHFRGYFVCEYRFILFLLSFVFFLVFLHVTVLSFILYIIPTHFGSVLH
jgi:hypothetical protein